MKEKVEKYEFIYDVPPEDKIKSNQFFNIINPDVGPISTLNIQAPRDDGMLNRLKANGASATLSQMEDREMPQSIKDLLEGKKTAGASSVMFKRPQLS